MPPTTRKKRVTKSQASQLVKNKQQSPPPLTPRLNFLASVISTPKLQASTVAKMQTEAPTEQSALLNPTHVVGSASIAVMPALPPDTYQSPLSAEICRLFNENRCRFPKCRYQHACTKCGENHPAVSCAKGPGPIAPPSGAASRRDVARPY